MERTSPWHRTRRMAEIEEANWQQQQQERSSRFHFHFSWKRTKLEVEEELSTVATLAWAEGVRVGKMERSTAECIADP